MLYQVSSPNLPSHEEVTFPVKSHTGLVVYNIWAFLGAGAAGQVYNFSLNLLILWDCLVSPSVGLIHDQVGLSEPLLPHAEGKQYTEPIWSWQGAKIRS